MEKKKVAFCLIKAFSGAERVAFKQKIRCGKTAKNGERLEKLFVALEKAVELDNIEEIKSTRLVKVLKLSSPKKLTPFYTELIEDLKQFLIRSELKEEQLQQQLLLQKALCRREETTYLSVLHEEIRNEIIDVEIPVPEDYQLRAEFYNSLYIHPNTNTRKEEALVYLNRSEVNLDTSYWISKLRLLVEKANRGITLAEESYLLDELPELPDLTALTYNNNAHILTLYTKIYSFALAPFQREDLQSVLELMVQYSNQIGKEDKERISNYLFGIINYYRAKKQTNLSSRDIYEVYKISFVNLWLVQDNGLIYFEDYLNLLHLAFNYEDTELIENINQDYLQYCATDYQPFIGMLAKGYNYFLHQQWEAVLKAFSNQELPSREHRLHFMMHRNTLEIKTMFESFVQDKLELDDIPSCLDKHIRFLQRKSNTYSNHHKDRNLQFVKFLRRLYIYLTKRNTFSFDKNQARKDLSEWIGDVEQAGANTIDQKWLQATGQTLLKEVAMPA